MRFKRTLALSAVAIAATSTLVATTTTANADESTNPTFNVAPAGPAYRADAYGAKANGLITLKPTAEATCRYDGGNPSR